MHCIVIQTATDTYHGVLLEQKENVERVYIFAMNDKVRDYGIVTIVRPHLGYCSIIDAEPTDLNELAKLIQLSTMRLKHQPRVLVNPYFIAGLDTIDYEDEGPHVMETVKR